jgi:hypothetical protein
LLHRQFPFHARMGEIGECYHCYAYELLGGAETLPV